MTFAHRTLLVDPNRTQTDRLLELISADVAAGRIMIPWTFGRILYDRYFEVLSGGKTGDQVVTGPYNNVRGMTDGDPVKIEGAPVKKTS